MFYRFRNQDERRAFGGGDFCELQFCRRPAGTPIKQIVDKVEFWRDDSLYIPGDDMELFDREYGGIFTGGTYNNLQTGPWDEYGINYYDPALTEKIIADILEKKPAEHETLLKWLYEARGCNGFYLLGV